MRKIHALTDEIGRPRVLLLTPGNVDDGTMASALLADAGPIRRLIADKAYDANTLRNLISERSAKAVIPSTGSRKACIPYDKDIDRQRNRIERLWNRLKTPGASQPDTTGSSDMTLQSTPIGSLAS